MANEADFLQIQASLAHLTGQVSRMTEVIERLATIEERNNNLVNRIDGIERNLQRQLDVLASTLTSVMQQNQENKYSTGKLIAVLSAAATAAGLLVPSLFERMFF